MPYDPENPPDKTRKLSAKKRRQWVHVFNSCWERHGDEGKCHAMAWGVANKCMDPDMLKDYIECCVGEVSPAVENLLKFSAAAPKLSGPKPSTPGAPGAGRRGAGVGETREWGGRKYVKTPKGWKAAAGKAGAYGKPKWQAHHGKGYVGGSIPEHHHAHLKGAGVHEESDEVAELHGFKRTLGPRGHGRSIHQLKAAFVAHMHPANYKSYKEFSRAKERIGKMPPAVFGSLLAALRGDEEEATVKA